MTKEEQGKIFMIVESGGFMLSAGMPDLSSLDYPTRDYEWQKVFRFISRNGCQISDKKTGNVNAPSTIHSKLVSRKLIEEDHFDLRKYLVSEHYQDLTKRMLSDHPKCDGDGCENAGTKVYLKIFTNLYNETREDVAVLCNSCRLVKGVIYTNLDKKKMVEEAMNDPVFRDIMKDAVKEYITTEAMKLLSK